jgi:predicted transcriptional regulator of viral defense system
MKSDAQNITRSPLGRIESTLLSRVGTKAVFTVEDAREILGPRQAVHVGQILARLCKKGWIARIKTGLFAVIPLSSGEARTPQLHEFAIAMELVKPAAIAYLSAMNYHDMTEQLPRTVFIATDHKVRRPNRESLGYTFRIVSLRKPRFFGTVKEWINEQPFMITDRERTIIDALDMPENCGGMGIVAGAIRSSWRSLDEPRLRDYATRIGNAAVGKRLGFLMEALSIGDVEALRKSIRVTAGFPRLDPTLPARGTYNRRWGLLINARVKE